MEITGLPLHPLLVHLVVVGLPVTALAAIMASLWPAAQQRLGAALPVAALVMAVTVPITAQAGRSLALVHGVPPRHQALGEALPWWALALAVVVVVQWLHRWRSTQQTTGADPGGASHRGRWLLAIPVVLVSVGVIVMTVLTGDSGARSVWGS